MTYATFYDYLTDTGQTMESYSQSTTDIVNRLMSDPSYVMTPQEFQLYLGRTPTSQQELVDQSNGIRGVIEQAYPSGEFNEKLGTMFGAGAMGGIAATGIAAGAGALGEGGAGVMSLGTDMTLGASLGPLEATSAMTAGGLQTAGGSMDEFIQLLSDGGDELAWDPEGADADYLTKWLSDGASQGGTSFTSLAKTALSRILQNGGSTDDWVSVLGSAAPGLLQAFGNYQSGQDIKDLAAQQKGQFDEYKAMGAPYRTRLGDLVRDPSSFLSSPEVQVPVQQGTDALARALSSKVGNPVGNMSAQGELMNYASGKLFSRLGEEKDRMAGYGGLTPYNNTAAGAPLATQLSQLGIGADAGIYGGVGRAVGDVFNPAPNSYEQFLKMLSGNNPFKVT
jgi:hypothetical protein